MHACIYLARRVHFCAVLARQQALKPSVGLGRKPSAGAMINLAIERGLERPKPGRLLSVLSISINNFRPYSTTVEQRAAR